MALTHCIESFEALLLFSSFFLIYLNPNPLSFLEMIVFARDLPEKVCLYTRICSPSVSFLWKLLGIYNYRSFYYLFSFFLRDTTTL